eukprot:5974892-Alexandrium_andersonii.AAC.1
MVFHIGSWPADSQRGHHSCNQPAGGSRDVFAISPPSVWTIVGYALSEAACRVCRVLGCGGCRL